MRYSLAMHLNQPESYQIDVISELNKFHKFLGYEIPFSDIPIILGYKESNNKIKIKHKFS